MSVLRYTPELLPANAFDRRPAEMVAPNDATEDEDIYVRAADYHALVDRFRRARNLLLEIAESDSRWRNAVERALEQDPA